MQCSRHFRYSTQNIGYSCWPRDSAMVSDRGVQLAARIRPATPSNPALDYLQRTLFTDLFFSVIFCLVCIVNKLTIC